MVGTPRATRKWWYCEETSSVRLPEGHLAHVKLCSWGIWRVHVEAHFDFENVPVKHMNLAYKLMLEIATARAKQLTKKRDYPPLGINISGLG